MPSHSLKRGLLASTSCLLLTALGFVCLLANNSIFLALYRSQLALSPSSSTFPAWQDLPFPMPTSFYLFHVLNPEQISKGAKPELEQRGPYTFFEKHHKTDLVWNKNGTITYKQVKTWRFDPDLSNGTLDDQVTILNSVAAGLGPALEKIPVKYRWPVNFFLNGIQEKLFIDTTVKDIMFEGIHDPLFDQLETLTEMVPALSKLFPPGSVTDKFAFLYGRNGTSYADGVWNMHTGVRDVTSMGQVNSWNYSTRWAYPGECGRVRGSSGEFFPPGQGKTYVEVYSNDLCRSLRFNFNQTVDDTKVDLFEYIADKTLFENGTENVNNSCYEETGASLPSGVFNSSLCRFGVPVFISQPHFYQADPYFLSLLGEGLEPDREKHRSFIRLEPVTGVTAGLNVRMQVNMMLAPVKGISLLENVSKSFFPVFWSENAVAMTDDVAFKIKILANLTFILSGVGWSCVGITISLVIIFSIFQITKEPEDDRSPILSHSLQDDSVDDNVFLSNDED